MRYLLMLAVDAAAAAASSVQCKCTARYGRHASSTGKFGTTFMFSYIAVSSTIYQLKQSVHL